MSWIIIGFIADWTLSKHKIADRPSVLDLWASTFIMIFLHRQSLRLHTARPSLAMVLGGHSPGLCKPEELWVSKVWLLTGNEGGLTMVHHKAGLHKRLHCETKKIIPLEIILFSDWVKLLRLAALCMPLLPLSRSHPHPHHCCGIHVLINCTGHSNVWEKNASGDEKFDWDKRPIYAHRTIQATVSENTKKTDD